MMTPRDELRSGAGEIVNAVYRPNRLRLGLSELSGSVIGLVAGLAFALFSGADAGVAAATILFMVGGSAAALFRSVSGAKLRFGADWVDSGADTVRIRKAQIERLQIIDLNRLRLHGREGEALLVDLRHYDFMDQQMIRLRLTTLAGGVTSTPAKALLVEYGRPRFGRRKSEG